MARRKPPSQTPPEWTIHLDPRTQTSVAVAAAWTMYAGTKVLVRTGEYFDMFPEARGHDSPFDEECYARNAMTETWQARTEQTAADPYLDLLAQVRRAGFIREYVWRFVREPSWPDPGALKLDAFDAWVAQNGLTQHKAATLATVSEN